MPFEFIQIPANGQGSVKEDLNKLLRGGSHTAPENYSLTRSNSPACPPC
jgi:hypothetical protein